MDGSQRRGAPRPLPWLEWRVGERVTLLYREEGNLQEVVGELLQCGPHGVLIRSRRGDVSVHATQMVVGRRVDLVPPRPDAPPRSP